MVCTKGVLGLISLGFGSFFLFFLFFGYFNEVLGFFCADFLVFLVGFLCDCNGVLSKFFGWVNV